MRLFFKVKEKINKILMSYLFLYVYSLFYEKEYLKNKKDIVKKNNLVQLRVWEKLSKEVIFILKNLHPRYFLASPAARIAYSPIGHTLVNCNKKYILKDINLYSFYSSFLTEAYGFLDYQTAFSWIANWGSILNFALEESSSVQSIPSSIIEFGSGLGIFPIILSSKYQNTKFFLYDLPIMLSLQKVNHNYLSNLGFPTNESKFNYFDNLDDLKNNSTLLESDENTFFIAYWSFSEAPLKLREKFIPILKVCSKVIVVSNAGISGIDNIKYFEELSIILKNSHEYLKLKLPLENEFSNKNNVFKNHLIHVYTMKGN